MKEKVTKSSRQFDAEHFLGCVFSADELPGGKRSPGVAIHRSWFQLRAVLGNGRRFCFGPVLYVRPKGSVQPKAKALKQAFSLGGVNGGSQVPLTGSGKAAILKHMSPFPSTSLRT